MNGFCPYCGVQLTPENSRWERDEVTGQLVPMYLPHWHYTGEPRRLCFTSNSNRCRKCTIYFEQCRQLKLKGIHFGMNAVWAYVSAKVCDSCHQPFTPDNPKVLDHCHICMQYRGALHSKCNSGLLSDDVELMKLKIQYLEDRCHCWKKIGGENVEKATFENV